MDNFFTSLDNTKPYFKAALEGFAGSGKTYTAAQVAIGLHKRIGSKLPIVIFDTEKAAKFLKQIFAEAGIEVLLRESRSLSDLKMTMQYMREQKISDILLIDSISHIWEDVLESYKRNKAKNKNFLEFQDWGIIKPLWKKEFSEPFVNDSYHVIMCGRAGYEYDNEKNEETGKREIYKSGVKMKVEGETAYEPDVLVYMERFEQVVDTDVKKVWREATILKDRSTILDGKTFKNPSFKDFAPSIEAMLSNPILKKADLLPEGDTALLFPDEERKNEWKREKDKAREEVEGLLTRIAPGNTGKDKQFKLDLLDEVFGTTSDTAIAELSPQRLREGYKIIGEKAVAMGIAEIITLEDGRKRLQATDPQAKRKADEQKAIEELKKEVEATSEQKQIDLPTEEPKKKRGRPAKAKPLLEVSEKMLDSIVGPEKEPFQEQKAFNGIFANSK